MRKEGFEGGIRGDQEDTLHNNAWVVEYKTIITLFPCIFHRIRIKPAHNIYKPIATIHFQIIFTTP